MGSGGHTLGRMLADRLGIPFHDRELLAQAAVQAGLDPAFFERNDERRPHFISGLFNFNMGTGLMAPYSGSSSISDDALYRAQCDFILGLADKGPCVIVGRTADYVLRNRPNVLNVFVHADTPDCARRVAARTPGMTPAQAQRHVERTNRLRAAFYNFYTDKKWGDASGYDMTFNSSRLRLEQIASIIAAHVTDPANHQTPQI